MNRASLIAVLALSFATSLSCLEAELSDVDRFAIAAQKDHEEARRLLSSGVDPNGALIDGATPLFVAAHTSSVAYVRFLLESGADPNKPVAVFQDRTPLMGAAETGSADVVRELLKAGADPARRDKEGKSAEDIARERGDANVLAALEGH